MRELRDQELEEAVQLVAVAAQRPASATRGRRPLPRASARRAAAGRGSARRGRAPAPRRPRQSARRAARRRSRRAPRCGPSSRRARVRGTTLPTSSAACASSSRRRRPRRPGLPQAPRSSRRQSTAASRCGSRPPLAPSATSSRTAVGRLPPPAERPAEVGRGQLAGRLEHDAGRARCRAASCGAESASAAATCARARSCAIAPQAPPSSTRCELVSERAAGGAQRRSVDLLLRRRREARAAAAPVSGPFGAHGLDDPALEPFRLHGVGSRRGAWARAAARRRRPRGRGACRRTRARVRAGRPSPPRGSPSPPSSRGTCRRHRAPPSSRSGLPFTCSQSEGSTTSAFGKSSARPTRSTHAAACSRVRTRAIRTRLG